MKVSFAAILAFGAIFTTTTAHDDNDSPEDHPRHVLRKHLTCSSDGGTATISFPCPSHHHHHPHGKKHSETITAYVPQKTYGIDCQAKSGGPSCAVVEFASMTCMPEDGNGGGKKKDKRHDKTHGDTQPTVICKAAHSSKTHKSHKAHKTKEA